MLADYNKDFNNIKKVNVANAVAMHKCHGKWMVQILQSINCQGVNMLVDIFVSEGNTMPSRTCSAASSTPPA